MFLEGEGIIMNLFLIADAECGGLLPLVRVLAAVIRLFWILIPVGLIIYGTVDLGKAVIASDEKEVKSAQSRLIKRFIYAAVVFFVPILVGVVMNLVAAGDPGDTDSWSGCWNAAWQNS